MINQARVKLEAGSVLAAVLLFFTVSCSGKHGDSRLNELNFIDIAAESVKFADVPAIINNLNRVLVFSTSSLNIARGLSDEKDDKVKMQEYLQSLRLGNPNELQVESGPVACPESGERDNQIVSLEPNSVNMTVSLAQCGYNGKVANGFVQITKLDIQGVPLANEVWTMAVNLHFDLMLTDAKGITPAVGLTGNADFTMTANGQLYSMSISGDSLRMSTGKKQQTLIKYNLITAIDSGSGYYSFAIDADYQSERFGVFHIKTNPNLVVHGGNLSCGGVLFITADQASVNPKGANVKIIADEDCVGMALQLDRDGDGVFDAKTATSWEYLSSL